METLGTVLFGNRGWKFGQRPTARKRVLRGLGVGFMAH